MIEFVAAPDHVFAVRLVGTLTSEDVERAVAEIEARLQRHKRIGIFADLTGFEDMTAEALARDFKYSFGKFGEWKRFPREAIVTDKKWVRALAAIADPLIPPVEIKAFTPGEREQALAWASDVTADVEPA